MRAVRGLIITIGIICLFIGTIKSIIASQVITEPIRAYLAEYVETRLNNTDKRVEELSQLRTSVVELRIQNETRLVRLESSIDAFSWMLRAIAGAVLAQLIEMLFRLRKGVVR